MESLRGTAVMSPRDPDQPAEVVRIEFVISGKLQFEGMNGLGQEFSQCFLLFGRLRQFASQKIVPELF